MERPDSARIIEELTRCTERLDRLLDRLDVLERIVSGNGHPAQGLVIRLDRLETTAQRNRWLIHSVIGACLAALVGALVHYLR